MVKLNTTYDSTINQKIFVLKGDEGYARTTDVIASLNTSFSDFDSHMGYCHVGLDIEVVRELGDSTLLIFNNDELLYSIPYSDSNMGKIIDSDWNEKGVYWEDNHLVIGKKESDPLYINTGLFLLYDTEYNIKIKYLGNKNCLGSHKDIVFNIPTPTAFESTLTLSSPSPRYLPNASIDNVTVLFESDNTIENTKTVEIYNGDVHLQTVTVTKDVPLTLDLGTLPDGLYTLKAVFNGDDEAFASETTYDISVGYKVMNVSYPKFVLDGQTGSFSCIIRDYFNQPYVGESVAVSEYTDGSGWSNISQIVETDANGKATIEPVCYTSKPFALSVGVIDVWHDVTHTTDIVIVDRIEVTDSEPYAGDVDYFLYITTYRNGEKIPYNLPVEYTVRYLDGTTYTDVTYSDRIHDTRVRGHATVDVTVLNTNVSTTAHIYDYDVWFGKNHIDGFPDIRNNMNVDISSNGIRYTGLTGNRNEYNKGYVGWYLGTDGSDTVTWHMDFDYNGTTNVTKGYEPWICGLKLGTNIKLKTGDHVKIIRHPDYSNDVYVNGNFYKTYEYDKHDYFYITVSKQSSIYIDELKILRYSKEQ